MDGSAVQDFIAPSGLLRIEDCLSPDGDVVLPPGVTLSALIDRNIANVGSATAYRYLDYSRSDEAQVIELTWAQLGVRMHAIGARLQRIATRDQRVAILAPQGLDYVAGFFAAIKAGHVAVPLFAPELPGHAERLDVALRDAQPTVVLTGTGRGTKGTTSTAPSRGWTPWWVRRSMAPTAAPMPRWGFFRFR